MKYRLKNIVPLLVFIAAIALFFWYQDANATKRPPPTPVGQEQSQAQKQYQKQSQHQKQNQHQTSESNSYSESKSVSKSSSNSDASANNEGNSLSVNSEAGPADIVLVPQGHTSNCMRTYGLSFGNTNGGGGLGWPYRDKSCDFDANAQAADLQGRYDLGWFWRCQKKNSYKPFKVKGDTVEAAIERCVVRNSGSNALVEELKAVSKERDAALVIIKERDLEAARLKQEVAEKRLSEAVQK